MRSAPVSRAAVMPAGSGSANSETRKPPFFSRRTIGAELIGMADEIPAMIGGRLRRIVRHQRHLVRLVLFHKAQEILVGIALDVEFRVREFVVDQRAQHRQVGMARVPLVRARMHGQPVRAGGQRDAPDPLDTRPWQVAPVAQHGDGVEVDGKLGGHGENSAATMRTPSL